jgi:hypothetical protein
LQCGEVSSLRSLRCAGDELPKPEDLQRLQLKSAHHINKSLAESFYM